MKSHLRLISPTDVNGAVAVHGTSAAAARTPRRPAATMPRRPKNAELRPREYLTATEVNRLLAAAKSNRHGHRDATMILIAYRHGLRAAEVCDLRWSQVDLDQARLHVRRVKEGTPAVHPLQGDELRALRRLKRESPVHSEFVFVNERATPFATVGFAFLVSRAGAKAGLPFKAHPYMLRHACGYALINKGADLRSLQSYLGHVSVTHTTRYAQLSAAAFNNFWRD
jgi:integrase